MPDLTVSYIKPDYSLCQKIFENQLLIWNISLGSAMPVHKLFTLEDRGGFVIGAFDQTDIIGHAVLMPAWDSQRHEPFLYLDMVGVLPLYRNQHLAERMVRLAGKRAQELQYASMQWTFDPLESANANLYIKKLGARAVRFHRDYYGLAPTLPQAADRFWVRWEFTSHTIPLNRPERTISLASNEAIGFPKRGEPIAIAVPRDFRDIIQTAPDHAEAVRLRSREVFTPLFQADYTITGFLRAESQNYYIASHPHTEVE